MKNSFANPPETKPLAREPAGTQSGIARLSLVVYPDQVLRTVCHPVERFDSTLSDVADEMLTLMQQHRGVGLAAPQVGLRQRLIVCGLEDRLFALTNFEVKDFFRAARFCRGLLKPAGRAGQRATAGTHPGHGLRRAWSKAQFRRGGTLGARDPTRTGSSERCADL